MIYPLITITGPSGSGKTTIVQELCKRGKYKSTDPISWAVPLGFQEAISTTTRPQRVGERDGIDYLFVSDQQFSSIESDGGFYENVEFNGNRYGIEKKELDFKVKWGSTLLIVEPIGIRHINENYSLGKVLNVWIDASGYECYLKMLNRGDSETKARERYYHDSTYFPPYLLDLPWDHVINNQDLDDTCEKIEDIVSSL